MKKLKMKTLNIIKYFFGILGFAGAILFLGALGGYDTDVTTFSEAVKYMLIAGLILVVAFLGVVVTEYFQYERISPDELPDGWSLLDLYEDEPDVCVRAGCNESETSYDSKTGITTETLRMCPFGYVFEPAERVITPDEEHTEAYIGGKNA